MASVTKTITEAVDGSGNPSVTTSLYFASFEDFMEYERVVGVVNSGTTTPASVAIEDGAQSVNIKIGGEYKIIGNFKDHEFPIGTVVRVVHRPSTGEGYMAEYLDGHDWWWVYAQDLEEV